MGQLVKLQDYISRYETDIFVYPSRFIRMKRKQWEYQKNRWEAGIEPETSNDALSVIQSDDKPDSVLKKITGLFYKNKENGKEEEQFWNKSRQNENDNLRAATLDELKRQFLEDIFRVQIMWASSTLTERSYVDSSFYKEEKLKFLLQRFPDTFLLFYKPVFLLKKAPVQGESILITPTEALCLFFLEEENQAVFFGSDERFWEKRINGKIEKRLNPLISLTRTETIIRGIFQNLGVDFPVKHVIISRNGYIDYSSPPYGVILTDSRSFQDWYQELRQFRSPMKHEQLKAAKSLLEFCKTTAVIRTEWSPS